MPPQKVVKLMHLQCNSKGRAFLCICRSFCSQYNCYGRFQRCDSLTGLWPPDKSLVKLAPAYASACMTCACHNQATLVSTPQRTVEQGMEMGSKIHQFIDCLSIWKPYPYLCSDTIATAVGVVGKIVFFELNQITVLSTLVQLV